ncbi:hypothetical protein ABPG75_000598 [Micractinium tetrahymenae]
MDSALERRLVRCSCCGGSGVADAGLICVPVFSALVTQSAALHVADTCTRLKQAPNPDISDQPGMSPPQAPGPVCKVVRRTVAVKRGAARRDLGPFQSSEEAQLACRLLQEEASGLKQGPADFSRFDELAEQLQQCADELARQHGEGAMAAPVAAAGPSWPSALLSAQELAQDIIAVQLPREDKLHLAATCKTLRRASLRWFPEVGATIALDARAAEAARSLALWLRSYRALTQLQQLELSLCHVEDIGMLAPLTAAPTLLSLHGGRDQAGCSISAGWEHLRPLRLLANLDLAACRRPPLALPEDLSTLTALTRLDVRRNPGLTGGWQHLAPLTRLREPLRD